MELAPIYPSRASSDISQVFLKFLKKNTDTLIMPKVLKFLSLAAISIHLLQVNAGATPPAVRGILFKLGPSAPASSLQAARAVLTNQGLTFEKQYKNVNIYLFKFATAKTDGGTLLRICDELTRTPGIEFCELDQKIQEVPVRPVKNTGRKYKINSHFATRRTPLPQDSCRLAPNEKDYTGNPGFTDYWAQEYTGADLLRKQIAAKTIRAPQGLIGELDSTFEGHMFAVRNLIASDKPSAILPNAGIEPIDVDRAGDYASHYLDYAEKCRFEKNCPKYINNSMGWHDSQTIYNALEELTQDGTIIISSAGNDGMEKEAPQIKRAASQKLGVILVGSMRPFGGQSDFSQHGDVTILVPADYNILSFDKDAKPTEFSGTSAATPQVTSVLATFTAITGYDLNKDEAKALLTKTVTRTFSSLLDPQIHGPGFLNAEKIGTIAFALKELCGSEEPRKQACIRETLTRPETYTLFPKKDLTHEKALFPSCFGTTENSSRPSSECAERQLAFGQIRIEALLHPEDLQLLRGVACIYEQAGYPKTAQFFTGSALVNSKDPIEPIASWLNEMINKIQTNEANVLFLLSQPFLQGHPELIEKLTGKENYDPQIAEIVLSQPQWRNNPKLVEKLLERGNSDHELAVFVLSQPQWQEHPEWVEKLINKGGVDRQIEIDVLPQSWWQGHPEWIEKMILKAPTAVELEVIDDYVLSKAWWQEVFRKRLGDQPVTAENIKKMLETAH